MNVTLLAHTPDPERLVASAARLCYSPRSIGEVVDGFGPEETTRLVRMLRRRGHLSPFEHVNFTFGVEGMSRAALAQFTRHRLASFSVQSQRYVRSDRGEPLVPGTVSRNPRAVAVYAELQDQAAQAYARLLELGIPREDARFCLTQGAPTSLIVTMNARELLWVARLRMCHTAQWEIRRAVTHMVRLARAQAPTMFERAGPPCRSDGVCPEPESGCKVLKRLRRFRRRGD